jgi:hypothetical protein
MSDKQNREMYLKGTKNMPIDDRWLSPEQAAKLMSQLAGYKITQDDLKQMRRRGKIINAQEVSRRLYLYDAEEIKTAKPPKKRNPEPI